MRDAIVEYFPEIVLDPVEDQLVPVASVIVDPMRLHPDHQLWPDSVNQDDP